MIAMELLSILNKFAFIKTIIQSVNKCCFNLKSRVVDAMNRVHTCELIKVICDVESKIVDVRKFEIDKVDFI